MKLEGQDAADFLFGSLDGAARDEVRLRSREEWETPEQLFAVLRETFGEKLTATQLLQRFYGRRQRERESIQDFSHSLMVVREEALRSAEEDRPPPRTAYSREVEAESAECQQVTAPQSKLIQELLASQKVLTEGLQKQQQVLADTQASLATLANRVQGREARWSALTCYTCGRVGHISRFCTSQQDQATPQEPDDWTQQWKEEAREEEGRRVVKLQCPTAVSHAAGANHGGSISTQEPEEGVKLVGTTPTAVARIGGVPVRGLVDTGSMVTLVRETFFPGPATVCARGCPEELHSGAEGSKWAGHSLRRLCMHHGRDGRGIYSQLSDLYKKGYPRIFGANLLSQVPEFKKLMTEDKKRTGFAKVAGSCNVWVPPFSEADVLVTGPQWGCSAVVEPLSVPICGNLSVASTLVNTSRVCFVVKVAN
ncbi:predicted protein [Nematostella vectensis]|uniref:CCHC-type domain-containing protein n=1 Tax=Nematostella vectensis TaxID=45351 RepID=A7SXV6_NEMVE|nr:predicted protein [Nematostella vectensis]|eukprot:XP_001623564.1 predicted protein [Nematostella vectensis]